MGHSRDARRLQRLADTRVRVAVLVDRPKGFARPKAGFSEPTDEGAGITGLVHVLSEARRADARDPEVETGLGRGVLVGITDVDLVIADRGRFSGRPRRILRRDPIGDVSLRWLDDERDGLRSRVMVLEFPDGRWTILATPWKRLIPDDAVQLIQALGVRARRVPRADTDSTRH